MAEKLETMGVSVSSRTFSGTAYHGIVEAGNSAIGRLADAIDAFVKELPE